MGTNFRMGLWWNGRKIENVIQKTRTTWNKGIYT